MIKLNKKKEWEDNPHYCFNHYVADPNVDYDCDRCTKYNTAPDSCENYVSIGMMQPVTPDTYEATRFNEKGVDLTDRKELTDALQRGDVKGLLRKLVKLE